MAKDNKPTNTSSKLTSMTMEQLMASSYSKKLYFKRGDEVEGTVISQSDSDLVIDLGAKTEAILNKKELDPQKLENLKIGDSIKAYVAVPESTGGQIILTSQKATSSRMPYEKLKRWNKFLQAVTSKSRLTGKVMEINKGGLIVEIDGMRGFVPTSQVAFKTLVSAGKDGSFENLVGQDVSVGVIEVDPNNNRLILTSRTTISEDTLEKLKGIKVGQKIKVPVVMVVPFGLFIEYNGVEGLVFAQEVDWEKIEDLTKVYRVGQEVEAAVMSVDETLGRINLSIRQLSEDPFDEVAKDFQTDDVVKGTVREISAQGMSISLDNNLEGFIPAAKIEAGNEYTVGQATNFLVDSIDSGKRRINLTPFLTTTKGLLYK